MTPPLLSSRSHSIGASKTESAPSGSSGDWLIVYAPKSNGRHTMPPIALLGVTRRRSRAGRQFESQEHVFLHFFFRPYPRCCRLTLELEHTDAKSLVEQMIWPD